MNTAETKTVRALLRTPQSRFLVIICAATVLGLAIGVSLAARALVRSYERLEASAARDRGEQVRRAFEADLRQLETSARAYALWDGAAEFVQTGEPAVVDRVFSADAICAASMPRPAV
jgi:sensor domain CHASE-containing protein